MTSTYYDAISDVVPFERAVAFFAMVEPIREDAAERVRLALEQPWDGPSPDRDEDAANEYVTALIAERDN